MESDRLFALWRLLAATGMRRGEAIGLAWEDLDMEAGAVTIRRAWIPVDGVARFSEPKSRRSRRTIALDPVTLEALKHHAARQADEQSGWQEGLAAADLLRMAMSADAELTEAASRLSWQSLFAPARPPPLGLRQSEGCR